MATDYLHFTRQIALPSDRNSRLALKGWERRGLFGACLLGLALVGSMPAQAQALQEVVIGMPSSSLATALPRLTKEMGFFAKQGLEPRFIYMDNANVATTALVAGSVPMTVSGPGEVIAAQAQGHKVIAIATVYAGLAATLVISKAAADKSGISPTAPLVDRLKALNGLLIAASSATAAATIAFKGAASKLAGVELRFVYLTQQAMPAAMENGAIQGYLSSAPYWIFPVSKGTGVAWISAPKGEIPPEFAPANSSLLQTLPPYVSANPEVVKKVLAAIGEFSKAVEERPNDVKAALTKTFPDLDAQSIELFVAAESAAWKGKPPSAASMAQEIAFLKTSGVNLPNLDKLDPAGMVPR